MTVREDFYAHSSSLSLFQVHFFNSFFHRQLVTKGYNGVKRWTKKVSFNALSPALCSRGLG